MDTVEQQAFDLGWDHAAFGLDVPEDANKAFCDGYRAFRHSRKKSTHRPDKYDRKWLQIRRGAYARSKVFSPDITPEFLKSITPRSGRCPVTSENLTFGTGEHTDWSVDRANNDRGYVRGNIVIISQLANEAKGSRSLDQVAELAESSSATDGLTPEEWGRLAEIIEPAFGDDDHETTPIQHLAGQQIARGMPVSPLAKFQIVIAEAALDLWKVEDEDPVFGFLAQLQMAICETNAQKKAYRNLMREVFRRSGQQLAYWQLWETIRIQRRLLKFLKALGPTGISRLAEIQQALGGQPGEAG